MSDVVEIKRGPHGHWLPGVTGNPKGQGRNHVEIRRALEPHLAELVSKAIDLARSGDVAALKMCLDRIAPVTKSTYDTVNIPALATASSLADKCAAVIAAAGNGDVAPDVAATLLTALGALTRAVEVDDLSRRLAALEAKGLE